MKVNISGKAAVTRRANVFGPEENASHAQSKWLDFSNGPLATPGVSLFKRMIKKQRRSRSFTFGGGKGVGYRKVKMGKVLGDAPE